MFESRSDSPRMKNMKKLLLQFVQESYILFVLASESVLCVYHCGLRGAAMNRTAESILEIVALVNEYQHQLPMRSRSKDVQEIRDILLSRCNIDEVLSQSQAQVAAQDASHLGSAANIWQRDCPVSLRGSNDMNYGDARSPPFGAGIDPIRAEYRTIPT